MNYKAIVLDLDGTLMTSKNKISKKNKELLIKIQSLGIKVILASGRPTHGLINVSNELELEKYSGYILSYNGGRIIRGNDLSLIYDSYLDIEMISNLFIDSRILNAHFITYRDHYLITQDDDEFIQLESKINNLPIVRVPNLKDEIKDKSVKCMMTAQPSHIAEVEKKLKAKYNDQLSISRSMPFFLEFMPRGINKGNSLRILCKQLNIDLDHVIAIGDGYNDISLIETAGLGIAMRNACQELKDKAKYITFSNDEDGVSHVIEKFILNKKTKN